MTNNDILRRLRYIFDISDLKMVTLFGLVGQQVSRKQVSGWLRKEDDPSLEKCTDRQLAIFLNGFIIENRGKREGDPLEPEQVISNNIIFRKLIIALQLRNEEVLDIMMLAGLRLGKHELSAFFRRSDHKNYRICKDQILRNFFNGLQCKYRPKTQVKPPFKWVEKS